MYLKRLGKWRLSGNFLFVIPHILIIAPGSPGQLRLLKLCEGILLYAFATYSTWVILNCAFETSM